ncbi:MAG TPA: hypothetical protein VK658_16725, partial [Chryseolinea sp.]|nr:hypothetical protein [Chryseolinea sp.]
MRYLTFFLLLSCTMVVAQKKSLKAIDDFITLPGIESHIRFLSADEMRGRNTGSPELDIAANYLMTQFMSAGVTPGDGHSYFQAVSLMRLPVPGKVELTLEVDGASGSMAGVLIEGHSAQLTKPVVYAGYGTAADFDKVDVNGKIVVCLFGSQGSTKINEGILRTAPAKRLLASERGAQALVEIMALPGVPWGALQNYFSKSRVTLQEEESGIPHILIQNSEADPLKSL